MPEFAKQPEADQIGPKYMCMFCSYRSNEKIQVGGCPGCGTAWPYGEHRALRALQIISAVVFISISGFLFYASATALREILHSHKVSWWIFAIPFGVGWIFAAGGVASLFGKSWLFRVLFIFFGVTLRRRSAR
jgi:hypothetical protein